MPEATVLAVDRNAKMDRQGGSNAGAGKGFEATVELLVDATSLITSELCLLVAYAYTYMP